MSDRLTFQELIGSIEETSRQLARRAKVAVNTSLTLRNWLIGFYIDEYELNGADRAGYGEGLMDAVAEALSAKGLRHCDRRALYRYRAFYVAYPAIVGSLAPQSFTGLSLPRTLRLPRTVGAPTPQSDRPLASPPSPPPVDAASELVTRLSYTHFEQLVGIDDAAKRRFYEQRCVEGTWSVRELKRQIASLYFERTALSRDKEGLHERTRTEAEVEAAPLDVRDPYVFEFLGLKSAEVMGESELEDALLDKLQSFLLELGHGFCFEARQKRLLIGDTYNFVDLVFYHRVLKCHVLIELKVGKFTHEHVGQLNTYVSWYAANEATDGDSPPIGLLLCTEKDHTVVRYALAGMSNQLFVSRYQVALPTEEEIQGMLAGVFG